MLENPAAQVDELLILQRLAAFIRAEDLILHALEFLRDVALTVDGGLLAMVIGGNAADVGLGDFDEITKHGVVFDLQALDASALDLAVLQVRDPLPAEHGSVAEFIE